MADELWVYGHSGPVNEQPPVEEKPPEEPGVIPSVTPEEAERLLAQGIVVPAEGIILPRDVKYNQEIDTLNRNIQSTEKKWKPLIDNNGYFAGSDAEYNAYLADIARLQAKQAELDNEYKALLSISGRSRTEQIEWENRLKVEHPDLYELYKYQPEKFADEIKRLQTEVVASQAMVDKQNQALQSLDRYKSIDKNGKEGYDIKKFLMDNKNSTEAKQILREANFNQEDIDGAYAANQIVLEAVKYLDSVTSWQAMRAGKLPAADAVTLDKILLQLGIPTVKGSGILTWREMSDEDKQRVAEVYAQDPYKSNTFSALISDLSVMGSKNIGAQVLMAPIVALGAPLAKGLVGQPISAHDKANFAVAAALAIAQPLGLGARIAGVALIPAESAVFITTETALHWNEMSTPEKAVSLSFAAMLVMSSLPAGVRSNLYDRLKVAAKDERGFVGTPKDIVETIKKARPLTPHEEEYLKSALERVQIALEDKSPWRLADAAKYLKRVAEDMEMAGLYKEAQLMIDQPKAYIDGIAKQVENTPVEELQRKLQVADELSGEVKVKTISPEDVGMSEAEYSRFLQARKWNPDLTVEKFRHNEQTVISVIKVPETETIRPTAPITETTPADTASKAAMSELAKNILLMSEDELAKEGLGASDTEGVSTLPSQDTGDIGMMTESEYAKVLQQALEESKLAEMLAIVKGEEGFEVDSFEEYQAAVEFLAGYLNIPAAKIFQLRRTQDLIDFALLANPARFVDKLRELDKAQQAAVLSMLSPEIANAIETKDATALALALQTKLQTQTETQTELQTALQTALQTELQTETQTKTQLQTQTKTALQTALQTQLQTELATQLRTQTGLRTLTPPPKPPAPRPPKEPTKKQREEKKFKFEIPQEKKVVSEIAGGRLPITWKQGWAYWTVYPPYKTSDDIKCTRVPPPEAKIVSGPSSAYRSIEALGGNASVIFTIDMGIMDVKIDRPSDKPGKSGAIRFRRDKEQRTKSDLSVKGVRMS